MQLRSVTLRNWRSYAFSTFEFPRATKQKKVVLVGAMNGYGKTSLLMALYLGLFGRDGMSYLEVVTAQSEESERIRSYKQLMESILHRPALDAADEYLMMSVEIRFEDEDGHEFEVQRVWHFTSGGKLKQDDEEVVLTIDGKVKKVANQADASNKIADNLFSVHIMSCFFFDGEQAQRRVEAAGGVAMRQAIDALYGTSVLDELSDRLARYRDKIKPQSSDDDSVRATDIEVEKSKLVAIDDQLRTLRADHDALILDVAKENEALRAKSEKLGEITAGAIHDTHHLMRRAEELRQQVSALADKLQHGLVGLAIPIATRRLGSTIAKELNEEQENERDRISRDEMRKKADAVISAAIPQAGDTAVDPPLTSRQRSVLESMMRRVLVGTDQPDGTPETKPRWSFLGSADRALVLRRLSGSLSAGDDRIAHSAAEWGRLSVAKEAAQRKYTQFKDIEPRIKEITAAMDEITARRDQFDAKRRDREMQISGLQSNRTKLAASVGQMEERRKKLAPIERRVDLVQEVKLAIEDLRAELIPLVTEQLEELCSMHFCAMISEELKNHKVKLDERRGALLVSEAGEEISVNSLGGAQKRAFGLAFSLAVAAVSGRDLPLVIDTPVGNMDSRYRKIVLAHLATSAPGQVIFLSHDEEIAGEYDQHIDRFVSARFLVENRKARDGSGVSTVKPGKYFTARRSS